MTVKTGFSRLLDGMSDNKEYLTSPKPVDEDFSRSDWIHLRPAVDESYGGKDTTWKKERQA